MTVQAADNFSRSVGGCVAAPLFHCPSLGLHGQTMYVMVLALVSTNVTLLFLGHQRSSKNPCVYVFLYFGISSQVYFQREIECFVMGTCSKQCSKRLHGDTYDTPSQLIQSNAQRGCIAGSFK